MLSLGPRTSPGTTHPTDLGGSKGGLGAFWGFLPGLMLPCRGMLEELPLAHLPSGGSWQLLEGQEACGE